MLAVAGSAALALAIAGWADIATRIVARGGPVAMMRTWPARRIDAFLNPWRAGHRPCATSEAA